MRLVSYDLLRLARIGDFQGLPAHFEGGEGMRGRLLPLACGVLGHSLYSATGGAP